MGNGEWLLAALENWAPRRWAEEWDNVGLLVGNAAQDAKKVLVALDATEAVVAEAVAGGYDFLITHHPLIHDPLKKITAESATGRKILALARAGVNLYCAHTNLDKAPGGVNHRLYTHLHAALGFCEEPGFAAPLIDGGEDVPGLGLVATLPLPMPLRAFVSRVKEALSLDTVRFSGVGDAVVRRVGLCAGDASNSRYWRAAREKGCDVFVTGDLRYHGAQDALEAGMALVDISHYAGEVLIVDAIVRRLREEAAAANREIFIEATKTDGKIFSHC